MDWMLMPLRRYAEFSGRSRRKEYWMFTLLNVIIALVLILVTFGGMPFEAFSNPDAMAPESPGVLFWVGMVLLVIWAFAIFIPSIAVTIRRLHDRDMSGWWYLGAIIGGAIPFIGPLVSLAFIVLMALPGTAGPNRFGPDPKDPGQAEVFA